MSFRAVHDCCAVVLHVISTDNVQGQEEMRVIVDEKWTEGKLAAFFTCE